MSSAPMVLLADVCADALDVIESEFRDAGFETARALDGRLAWERFQERTPDLVVSDVRMPEIDGFDLLKKIRDVSDLPVILLTAYGEISLAVAAIGSGADDYLRMNGTSGTAIPLPNQGNYDSPPGLFFQWSEAGLAAALGVVALALYLLGPRIGLWLPGAPQFLWLGLGIVAGASWCWWLLILLSYATGRSLLPAKLAEQGPFLRLMSVTSRVAGPVRPPRLGGERRGEGVQRAGGGPGEGGGQGGAAPPHPSLYLEAGHRRRPGAVGQVRGAGVRGHARPTAGNSGNIYVANLWNHRIEVFDRNGKPLRELGVGLIYEPTGVAVDKNGNVYVAGSFLSSYGRGIAIFDKGFDPLTKFVGGEGILEGPYSIDVDDRGYIYVIDLTPNGTELVQFNDKGEKQLSFSDDFWGDILRIAVEPYEEDPNHPTSERTFYISDNKKKAIYKYNTVVPFLSSAHHAIVMATACSRTPLLP